MQLGRGGQTVQADGEVGAQLGRGCLAEGAAAEVKVQLDRRSLTMGTTAEMELQLRRGGNMEVGAGVVEVEGAFYELLLYTPPLFSIPVLEHPLFLVQEVFDVTSDPWFIIRIAQCPYKS